MWPIYLFMTLRKLDIMGSSLQDFICVEIFLAVIFDLIYRRYGCYLRFYSSVLPLKLKRYSSPLVIIIIIIIFAKLREMCSEVHLNILCPLFQYLSHEVGSDLLFSYIYPIKIINAKNLHKCNSINVLNVSLIYDIF
jgi:hypothetical protein